MAIEYCNLIAHVVFQVMYTIRISMSCFDTLNCTVFNQRLYFFCVQLIARKPWVIVNVHVYAQFFSQVTEVLKNTLLMRCVVEREQH